MPAQDELEDKLVAADVMFATVGGVVWGLASLKMSASLSAPNNAQAALGLAASECLAVMRAAHRNLIEFQNHVHAGWASAPAVV